MKNSLLKQGLLALIGCASLVFSATALSRGSDGPRVPPASQFEASSDIK